ncbi:MAG: DUF861 domain-containing protein [Gammaproteobacteria bacterium]|jgi:uncharacterized cupin superfamily protein|nr:DUF861 domain-containing protein [Gammaproteobacteria bacterium]
MKFGARHTYSWLIATIFSVLTLVSFNAVGDEKSSTDVVSPLRLDTDMISGIGLETVPWDDKTRLSKWSHLFTGKELSVSVFESTPKELGAIGHSKNRVRNYPYDQFVLVLSGKSVLTDETGNAQTFKAGDLFVVPRGFTGVWEEFGVYRELIVIQEEAVRTRKLEIEKVE